MRIELSGAGKRFNREWIFRATDLSFTSGNAYAITGANGSGKSTLLQCIGGMLQLSEGRMEFYTGNELVQPENAFTHISYCAPYLDVIEEMSLHEFLDFHSQFKPFLNQLTPGEIIKIIGLEAAAGKQIRLYSSGMKQRVKLAQAIFSNASAVLLDEPCSNLDQQGIDLYHNLIQNYCRDRLVMVCSNDPVEYSFCQQVISIHDFKPAARMA
ncbi:MAG: ABC transporter ATP-binding protein [Flavisolibacter sp.]